MVALSLKISIGNVVKTMQFEPSTMVYDARDRLGIGAVRTPSPSPTSAALDKTKFISGCSP